jgi:hypothetical protein
VSSGDGLGHNSARAETGLMLSWRAHL